jgi:hypothetical protein
MQKWRQIDWVAYGKAKAKSQGSTKSQALAKGQRPILASDAKELVHRPADGLAAFLLDPSLLPKKPPGGRA